MQQNASPQGPPQKFQKGAGKGKSNFQLLEGKLKMTAANEPICFNFNLRGCPNAKPGERCPRGWHVCAEPGCGKAHALTANH